MSRAHRLATLAWSVIAAGASLGFIARDLLGLPGVAVALAWIVGAFAGGAAAGTAGCGGSRGAGRASPGSARRPSV